VKLKILDAISQRPSKEYTFVGSSSYYTEYVFLSLLQGILLFYIGGTVIIGLLVPSNNPDLNLDTATAASSPFVIAIYNAGIKALPSVCS
jgi:Amino acid permease